MFLRMIECFNFTRNRYTRKKEIDNIYELRDVIKKDTNCILKRLGGETIALRKVQNVKKIRNTMYITTPNCKYTFMVM